MLNSLSKDWNCLYGHHQSVYSKGGVKIIEKGKQAKNKSLEIVCTESISFPSKDFCDYDLFGSLNNRNCDGALIINNNEDSYDLVFVEMKSRYDIRKVYEAKCQIVESLEKMISLLKMMRSFGMINIKRIIGIIETMQLDKSQEQWWSKRVMLPEEKLEFGDKLLKHKSLSAPTCCKKEFDVPDSMTFKILLSDKAHFTVNYPF